MTFIECEPGQFAPNGKPFVTLTSGGIKPEAEPCPLLFDAPEAAWAAYDASLEEYAGDGTIYLRSQPEMRRVGGKYVVWSRVAV